MLKKSEAIIFKCIKYGETSVIAQAMTPNDGIVSLIISGVRTIKNKGKAAQFQIGQLLNVVYYDKQKDGVMRLKESDISYHFQSIPSHIIKMAVMQYMIEVTRNAMYQTAIVADEVYPFLRNQLIYLDTVSPPHRNLAVYYLWQLIAKLGLLPNFREGNGDYFDLETGNYCDVLPRHGTFLAQELIQRTSRMAEVKIGNLDEIEFDTKERRTLLNKGHKYLNFHLSYFKEPHSVAVFHQILKS